ncbi:MULTISPECIES: GlcG/HbpS family heme-binding protein [Photobacterium]|uniref:Heme-binding protein n=1 Tax=Photobacterium arenosum TaxID=2774143 RepID=A0ABR9BNJ1_9GAMM|nr:MULTISPECIES: heme-binding protein [Photobacterium]MBD8513803.1 heme-binding protein [Photobacterium arenosum]NAW88455.1 heme-binding protein [Photobacterium halotolerans]
MSLTLDEALVITKGAFSTALTKGAAPLTVAVLDSGGKLISLQRQDGSSMLRPEIAIAKAWGALALGCSSRKLALDAQQRPAFMSAVNVLAEGNLLPVPGGVLIRGSNNCLLGAVGISGDLSELDELCAIAGIKAANLVADEVEVVE